MLTYTAQRTHVEKEYLHCEHTIIFINKPAVGISQRRTCFPTNAGPQLHTELCLVCEQGPGPPMFLPSSLILPRLCEVDMIDQKRSNGVKEGRKEVGKEGGRKGGRKVKRNAHSS